jgi:hypothetical protein
MDPEKLSYFRVRFADFDADALAELNERRDTLAEEACVALDQVLSDKGLSAKMLSRYSTAKPALPASVLRRSDWLDYNSSVHFSLCFLRQCLLGPCQGGCRCQLLLAF